MIVKNAFLNQHIDRKILKETLSSYFSGIAKTPRVQGMGGNGTRAAATLELQDFYHQPVTDIYLGQMVRLVAIFSPGRKEKLHCIVLRIEFNRDVLVCIVLHLVALYCLCIACHWVALYFICIVLYCIEFHCI